jgi:RNA polymerase sigma-70 factor (ECF subfamily)
VNAKGPSSKAEDLLPTRQSLLSRLKSWEDQASWQEFFATYWKLIYTTARQAGLSDAEAQDVVQETILGVCTHMPKFHYDPQKGSFKGWLLQLTYWRIKDQFRKRLPLNAERSDQTGTDPMAKVPDPAGCGLEERWEAEWNSNLWEAAVERVKLKVPPKQFQLFDLYVLHQWPISKICSFLNVGRGSIYLAKHRISRLIKKEVNYLMQKWT